MNQGMTVHIIRKNQLLNHQQAYRRKWLKRNLGKTPLILITSAEKKQGISGISNYIEGLNPHFKEIFEHEDLFEDEKQVNQP